MKTKQDLAAENQILTAEIRALQERVVETSRAVADAESRARQLDAVRAISAEVVRELDLASLLRLIVQRAAELTSAGGGAIHLWNDAQQILTPMAWYGKAEWRQGVIRRLGEGAIGTVAQRREGLLTNNYGEAPYARPETLARRRISAVLAEPLLYHDQLVGVIGLDNEGTGREFTGEDQRLLRLFAAQAAIAIENARLFAAARQELAMREQAEVEFRASEERYRTLVLNTPGIVYSCSVESPWRFSFISDEVAEVTGRPAALFLSPQGLTWADVVLAEDLPALERGVAAAVAARTHYELEYRILHADGRVRWVYEKGRAVAGAEDRPQWLEGIILDITSRKRVEAEASARARQMEAMRAVSVEITRELDLGRLLRLLLARLGDLVEGSQGSIHLWDEREQCLLPNVSELADGWRRSLRMQPGEGVSGTVAQRREGLIVNDFRNSPYCTPYHREHSRHTAVLAEPLLYRDRLLGVLTLDNEPSQRQFAPADQQLLRLFATQAAIAIENARLFQEAEARQQRLTTLIQVSQRLTRGLDLTAVLTGIAEAAATLFRCEAGFRLLEGEYLVRRAATPGAAGVMARERLRIGESLSGLVAESGEPLIASDTASDPRLHPDHRAAVQKTAGALMCLPIRMEGRILGTLHIFKERGHVFDQDEVALATTLADQAGIAIQNARLYADQRKAYEELQRAQEELVRSEKLRALGQMSAGIAHDLNNMLAAVLGQTELLRLRISDPAIRESLNTLEMAATDGAQVVRRLQEFARQRSQSPLRSVQLATLVAEAVEITRPRWQDEAVRRGVVIQVESAIPALPPVQGHEPEIREALTNLILNAVDAMPSGGTLTFAARIVEGPAGAQGSGGVGEPTPLRPSPSASLPLVELDVSDTGVGVPEEIQRRIFDPFFTTKGPRGTGLGLSVVYGIMERSGGSVGVRSVPGRGTTLTLRFQVAESAPTAPQGPRPAPTVSPRRLLIAEDEASVRDTLGHLLRSSGHDVVVAEDGPAALALLAERGADCLITDLGMPGMLGWEVAAKAKALRPDIPVILLTGWGETVMTEPGAESAAVDRVLSKPVRLADLLKAIRELTGAEE